MNWKTKADIHFNSIKNILIWGFGSEGKSTYKFLKKYYPKIKIGIADVKNITDKQYKDVSFHSGDNYLKDIDDYDLIIKSPGISISQIPITLLNRVTSQTELFLNIFRDQVIGISGTKGKSTTATLVHYFINESGNEALLMGNLGYPAFDFVDKIKKNTFIVYELSAHQLKDISVSPHWSLLLNIFPEHLDFFEDFDNYKAAKLNIFRFQKRNDFAFCGYEGELPDFNVKIKNLHKHNRDIKDLTGLDISIHDLIAKSPLKGLHNIKNIIAALSILSKTNINLSLAYKSLPNFKPLPHRLEFVGNYGGINFYNDSISTIPQSTIEALKSIKNVNMIILGGFDRGLNYNELVYFLIKNPVKYVFLMGKAGKRIHNLLIENHFPGNMFFVKDLEESFNILGTLKDVKICLLSPAAASYDQFKNFEHRGDVFKSKAINFNKKSGNNPP